MIEPQGDKSPAQPLDYAATIAAAKDAVQHAHYDRALALVSSAHDWPPPYNEEGTLYRVAALCARDPVAALEELVHAKDIFKTQGGRFGYLIASGRAYANTRSFESAAGMFGDAAAVAPELGKEEVALLAYSNARLKWLKRENDPNCGELDIAMRDGSVNTRFLAQVVRGWMYIGLEDYRAFVKELKEAIELALQNPGECNAEALGLTIHSLLRCAFELGDEAAYATAEAAMEQLEWTPDLQLDRFHSLRTLAWHAFLHGHSARAQWLFKDAKNAAPSAAWKVMSHLDRAYVARMNMNEIWATEELFEANRLARSVAWAETRGAERTTLTTLAIMFAPTDMAKAQRYISTYIGLGVENINPTMALSFDKRSAAFERYASGRIHQVLGNKELASQLLQAAYETFTKAEHHYRSAEAAYALYETTREAKWLEAAQGHAQRFPNSPLAERLADEVPTNDDAAPTPFQSLSTTEREIAIAYCHGSEIPELQERFGRSAKVIEHYLKTIFEMLGVSNRSELRTALSESGLSY